jgi:thiosulfate/3-mercaptopyruvate sulfurtransferase
MGSGSRAMLQEAGTRSDVLVEPRWLEEHLYDPALRLVEVDVSPVSYDKGHIEGAVLWNVYRDLKDMNYQLVEKAATERLVERSGIAPGRRWCSTATHPPWASGS